MKELVRERLEEAGRGGRLWDGSVCVLQAHGQLNVPEGEEKWKEEREEQRERENECLGHESTATLEKRERERELEDKDKRE